MGRIVVTFGLISLCLPGTGAEVRCAEPTGVSGPLFRAGYAERDITPPDGLPLWGYGARHALPAAGALDRLMARALVVHAGADKLAIVGLDLGRGPTQAMLEDIRARLREQLTLEHVLISGSHTHHGPVIELTDREGFGRGTYDTAVAYSRSLPEMIVEVVTEADRRARPARWGISTRSDLNLNRNRHSKREEKAVDPTLSVIRFDDLQGEPIGVVASFAAHAVMTDPMILKYSGDYPGHLARKVRAELGAGCVFMPGASGDLSPNPPGDYRDPEAFGALLAGHVLELVRATETAVPEQPSIAGCVDRFRFESRTDFRNPLVQLQYALAFFPELVRNFVHEFEEGIPAELNTVLLNGRVALVGGSGEFFCSHANRLRQRSYVDHTLFFGYCNGHSLYFPTIEAVSEGGYGADAAVSPAEIGAGERMMDRALINIYRLQGKIEPAAP